jgi:hypothetical protein
MQIERFPFEFILHTGEEGAFDSAWRFWVAEKEAKNGLGVTVMQ